MLSPNWWSGISSSIHSAGRPSAYPDLPSECTEETHHLDYEAYESMAEEKMAQIAEEIWARWPEVRGVALVQRLGRIDVGGTTTFVACAGG